MMQLCQAGAPLGTWGVAWTRCHFPSCDPSSACLLTLAVNGNDGKSFVLAQTYHPPHYDCWSVWPTSLSNRAWWCYFHTKSVLPEAFWYIFFPKQKSNILHLMVWGRLVSAATNCLLWCRTSDSMKCIALSLVYYCSLTETRSVLSELKTAASFTAETQSCPCHFRISLALWGVANTETH